MGDHGTSAASSHLQLRSVVLDGCPMFAPAYMGRKRIFQMLSLHSQGVSLLAAVLPTWRKRWKGAAPRLFRPMVPDFLHEVPTTEACAAFIKESRMEYVNARELNRGIRVYAGANMGHPSREEASFFTLAV